MVTEYNGLCNNKVRGSFRSLNTYLTIMMGIVGVAAVSFIVNLAISNGNNGFYPYGDIIPSYIGIALLVIFILTIFIISAVRTLRKQVCKKDGFRYGLFGSGDS